MTIRTLAIEHWPAVKAIYEQGIATGDATFQTSAPGWEEWDRSHLDHSRLVAMEGGQVAGWAALTPVSGRCVYAGVAEISVYIDQGHRGKGIGKALLEAVIASSEANNIWTLQAGIFPENAASIRLHETAGFRRVGIRERIGKMGDRWRDTVLFEKRSGIVGR